MADRPNVLVFFTDQQRYDSTGLHGNPLDLTPNLDRLARENTHVTHSFTCQPVCGPARACLQTGQYPTRTGHWRNSVKPLLDEQPTLAGTFRDAGYDTAYIGKWHLSINTPGPVQKEHRGGYDYWLASDALEMTSTDYSTTMYDNDCRPVTLPGYRVDAVADAMIRYLASRVTMQPVSFHAKHDGTPVTERRFPKPKQDKPFLLFASFIEPHHQNHVDDYPAPEGYRDRYTGRWTPPDLQALGGSAMRHLPGYWGMVKRLDEAFGRILDALTSLGLRENTIILFTSDHGSHFKTRNGEYKRSCHDSSIRVPTVLAGPGFKGGRRLEELVSLIDLPPTLIDAAGLNVPDTMQGRSILPIVRQERDAQWRDEVFVQISESQVARALRTRRWKYCVSAPDKSGWRDSSATTYKEESLYDLQNDPWELENLIGLKSHQPVTDHLRQRLLARIEEAGEQAAQILPAEDRPSGQRKVFVDEV